MGNRRFDRWAGIRSTWAALAFGLALLTGCANTPWPWRSHNSPDPKSVSSDAKAASPSPSKSSDSQTDAQSLKQVMSELQQVGAIDPVARDKLMADLKQVDPSLWPMVLQTFRAEAAYKRREEQREGEKNQQEAVASAAPHEHPSTQAIATDEKETRFELNSPDGQTSLSASRSATARPPGHHGPTIAGEGNKTPSTPAPSPSRREQQAGGGSEATAALPPQPKIISESKADNHLALAPESIGLKGIDIASGTPVAAVEKASETGAIPPEPSSVAARLAATCSDVSPKAVVPTEVAALGAAPLADANWQSHLTAAIQSIEHESKAGSKNESDIALQARLRMLYLLAGRRNDAMRPLPAAPQASQEYWSSQIFGLSTWMDAEKTPDTGRRAAATKRILDEALAQLGETAPLAVRNLTFCTEVFRFGSFDALKSTEFTPSQKVLLYAEVDNLHIESTPKGYHWSVKVSGQIFDNRGNRMVDYGSTSTEEYFQTQRHDFFVSKLYYLPRLIPGRYTLQLTIEDTLGHKVGQSSIDFTVKPQ